MSDKRKILVQLDTDPQPSVFDRVVAVDSGVDFLFTHHGVKPDQVQALVHGAVFTRGPKDLKSTAVFVGGSDVGAGEAVLAAVRKSFVPQYGLTVSVMLDSNGSNTTAAAAVRAASKHMDLGQARGAGPRRDRAGRAAGGAAAGPAGGGRADRVAVGRAGPGGGRGDEGGRAQRPRRGRLRRPGPATGRRPSKTATWSSPPGPPGPMLLPAKARAAAKNLHLMIDLNAVPPAGIEGVEVTDKAVTRDGVLCYGAIGVGDTKMKIHRAAVAQLFEKNNLVLDAEEIYELALRL